MAARLCFVLLLIALTSQSVDSTRQARTRVETRNGAIEGTTLTVQVQNTNVKVYEFLGIPYAEPPVGDLRFRRPVPAGRWEGTYQAKTPPNSCMQIETPQQPMNVSEDCLYLNLWRPRCRNSYRPGLNCPARSRNNGLAILIWIHGGFYYLGSSTDPVTNGATLAASECVIVVTVNYRLGVFGFLYQNNSEAPGSMGLQDQALAVKWVRDNAERFGGDPKSITVFGQSAGGSSAHFLMLSPLTRDIVSSAIIESTASYTRYLYHNPELALSTGNAFANLLNCQSDNKTASVECLRQVNAETLTLKHFELVANFSYSMAPTLDGEFFTEDPLVTSQKGDFRDKEIIIGSNQDEGTYLMGVVPFLAPYYNLSSPERPANMTKQDLLGNLTRIYSLLYYQQHVPEILQNTANVYNINQLGDEASYEFVELFNFILRDLAFKCPSRLIADYFSKSSGTAYLYEFEITPTTTGFPAWAGATHSAEAWFVFGTVRDTNTPIKEVRLSEIIMNYWATFAKCGNPNSGSLGSTKWCIYTPPDPSNVMKFTEAGSAQAEKTKASPCDFWNGIPMSYSIR